MSGEEGSTNPHECESVPCLVDLIMEGWSILDSIVTDSV